MDPIMTKNLAAWNKALKMGLEHFAKQSFHPAIFVPYNGLRPHKLKW